MNLSAISKKAVQFPILFVCAIATPLIIVLLIMRGPKVAQKEAELTDLENQWNNIQTNVERSGGLNDDIDALEAGLGEVQNRLMKVENVAVNYEFFYGLERKTGITLRQFSQGSATDGEKLPLGIGSLKTFSVIPYDIVMIGTLEQLLDFMDSLNHQEFIIRLDSLNLSLSQITTDPPGTLNGRLKCHVLAAKHE